MESKNGKETHSNIEMETQGGAGEQKNMNEKCDRLAVARGKLIDNFSYIPTIYLTQIYPAVEKNRKIFAIPSISCEKGRTREERKGMVGGGAEHGAWNNQRRK